MADAAKAAAILDSQIAKQPVVRQPAAYAEMVRELWHKGMPPGDKTGWPSVDKYYTVVPGQLSVLTGWPGSGKSEWLDALLINLSRQGWKFAIYSPENKPSETHIAKLAEKLIGKPFGAGPNERIMLQELDECIDELSQSFAFVETIEGAVTAKEVIHAATPYLVSFEECNRGLVVDPWNELEHWRPANLSETEYVSQTLSMVRNWARANRVHVWIVAHPQKMRREDGKLPIPRPDMIAGSSHWWNKSDCALTVWRDFEKLDSQDVDIHVQKVRFKHVGRPGVVTLKYDRVTGRYFESPRVMSAVRYE